MSEGDEIDIAGVSLVTSSEKLPQPAALDDESSHYYSTGRPSHYNLDRASVLPALALASAGVGGEHLHLGQKVALFFQKSGLPDWAVLLLISATPAIELRGARGLRQRLQLAP